MASLNKAQIIGRLGNDPEIRYTTGGDAVASFSVATSETWKDKSSGERQERTEWHRISAFGRTAEVVGEYLKKGALVYIEGRLQTRKWTDQDGNDRYTTAIICDRLQMLGSKSDAQRSENTAQKESIRPPGGNDDFDDDIPF